MLFVKEMNKTKEKIVILSHKLEGHKEAARDFCQGQYLTLMLRKSATSATLYVWIYFQNYENYVPTRVSQRTTAT